MLRSHCHMVGMKSGASANGTSGLGTRRGAFVPTGFHMICGTDDSFCLDWSAAERQAQLVARATSPAEREEAEACLVEAAKLARVSAPRRFIWLDSPRQCAEWLQAARGLPGGSKRLLGKPLGSYFMPPELQRPPMEALPMGEFASMGLSRDEMKIALSARWMNSPCLELKHLHYAAFPEITNFGSAVGGQFDAMELFAWRCFQWSRKPTHERLAAVMLRFAQVASWSWIHEDIALISERPTVVRLNERNELHQVGSPALAYRDGSAIYAFGGVCVPPWAALNPNALDAKEISRVENCESRRVLIERFGVERYLEGMSARLVAEDNFGRLYDLQRNRQRERVVVVKNATPEDDGTHKTYILAVPPGCRTPHEAVAWSFDLSPDDYRPSFET